MINDTLRFCERILVILKEQDVLLQRRSTSHRLEFMKNLHSGGGFQSLQSNRNGCEY